MICINVILTLYLLDLVFLVIVTFRLSKLARVSRHKHCPFQPLCSRIQIGQISSFPSHQQNQASRLDFPLISNPMCINKSAPCITKTHTHLSSRLPDQPPIFSWHTCLHASFVSPCHPCTPRHIIAWRISWSSDLVLANKVSFLAFRCLVQDTVVGTDMPRI